MFKHLAYLESTSISSFKKLEELPTSMASLTALKRLDIRSCHSLESLPEQVLEGLTSLMELFIQDCEMLKTLIRGIATPNNPYKTSSCSLSRDGDLAFEDSKLTLSSITGDLELPSYLQSLPAGIMDTENLQASRIVYCPELAKRCGKEIGEDWNKIAHIPNVQAYQLVLFVVLLPGKPSI